MKDIELEEKDKDEETYQGVKKHCWYIIVALVVLMIITIITIITTIVIYQNKVDEL